MVIFFSFRTARRFALATSGGDLVCVAVSLFCCVSACACENSTIAFCDSVNVHAMNVVISSLLMLLVVLTEGCFFVRYELQWSWIA